MSDDQSTDVRIEAWRRGIVPAAFRPGFSSRVIERLWRPMSFADSLQRSFGRILPIAAAAAVAAAIVNVRAARTTDQSVVDRMFGLPAVTLASAYAVVPRTSGATAP